MKAYFWNNEALTMSSPGTICMALADSPEHARQLIIEVVTAGKYSKQFKAAILEEVTKEPTDEKESPFVLLHERC